MDPRYPPATNPPPAKEPARRGRRKINIEYIPDKSRRQITFSKRKAGIMKKAYELATLTGTQVLLLVASESGHVYTFATPKLQPLITEQEGKNLIQNCLNAPTANSEPDNEQESPNSGLNIHSYAHKRELEEDDDEEDETVLRTPLKTEQKIPDYPPQNNYPQLPPNSAFTPGGNFLNQPLYGGRPNLVPSHPGISSSNPHSVSNPYLPPSHPLNPPFNPYGYPSQPPPYGPSNSGSSSSGYLMRPPSGMMLNPALDILHPSSHGSLQGHNGQLDDDDDDDGDDDD